MGKVIAVIISPAPAVAPLKWGLEQSAEPSSRAGQNANNYDNNKDRET